MSTALLQVTWDVNPIAGAKMNQAVPQTLQPFIWDKKKQEEKAMYNINGWSLDLPGISLADPSKPSIQWALASTNPAALSQPCEDRARGNYKDKKWMDTIKRVLINVSWHDEFVGLKLYRTVMDWWLHDTSPADHGESQQAQRVKLTSH